MKLATAAVVAGGVYLLARTRAERAIVTFEDSLARPSPDRITGPLVSVIIPTYNEAAYLPTLLRSLDHQSYRPYEVIVADSGTDNTADVAAELGAIVVQSPFGNLSRARNAGARAAHGAILFFVDADCSVTHELLASLVNELQRPGTALAWAPTLPYDSARDGALWAMASWAIPREWTTGRGIALWTEAFWAVGGYSADVNPLDGGREDRDLGAKITRRYGRSAIAFRRDLAIGTSLRRERVEGYKVLDGLFGGGQVWREAAVR